MLENSLECVTSLIDVRSSFYEDETLFSSFRLLGIFGLVDTVLLYFMGVSRAIMIKKNLSKRQNVLDYP